MKELWIRESNLIPEKEWIKAIDNLKTEELIRDKKQAKQSLKEKLTKAVEKRIPNKKFGIFFSGGVDSSLIAILCKQLKAESEKSDIPSQIDQRYARLRLGRISDPSFSNGCVSGCKLPANTPMEKEDFICYAVGFQDEKTKEPEDITEAKKVAKKFGFKLKYKLFNLEEAEEIIKKTVDILKKEGKTDVVNVGVGAVILAAAELGKKDRINYFFSGLGSEEIFAGYERHSKSDDIQEECWEGLKQMWDRDLVRDSSLSKSLGITIKTPFLDQELIKYAMKIPSEWKIDTERKKIILREAAEEFLGEFAWRKKKAAQYGSRFDKAISKLARKEGFKLKKEYLNRI